jgi:hypothetical protein
MGILTTKDGQGWRYISDAARCSLKKQERDSRDCFLLLESDPGG